MSISVLLANNQSILEAGIKSLLEEDLKIRVTGTTVKDEELLLLIIEKRPDIVLFDLATGKQDCMNLGRQINSNGLVTSMLVIAEYVNSSIVDGLIEMGVSGIILKDRIAIELLSAVHKLVRGEKHIPSYASKNTLDLQSENELSKQKINLPILSTKLHRPPISDDHIIRSDIIELLEKNLLKPLSLVAAPAGYGKSLTVSQWLHQTKAKSTWISLDEEHNDLRMFLAYLMTALDTIFPDALKETSKLIGAAELPPIKVIAYSLINEIDQIDQEFILVFDDYHHIHNSSIHDLVDIVLTYPPESMHICMVTRIDPPLKLTSLLANGRMLQIRMRQLAFSDLEIIELFHGLRHIALSKETARVLHNRTEGWIVGLRMASMIVQENENTEEILGHISGDIYSLSKYLLEEVLMKQSRKYQELLLITSLLNRFCPDLIDSITTDMVGKEGISNGNEFVNWLIKSNLFVISLDNQGIWFRYHHLIQDLLKKLFKDHKADKQIAAAHYNASIWFEQNGFIEEAIMHMLDAGNQIEACNIIERHRIAELNSDDWFVIQRWLQMIPEELKITRPELLLSEAWGAYENFNIEKIAMLLDLIKPLLNKSEGFDAIWGEFHLFHGLIAHWSGNGLEALQHFSDATDHLPGDYQLAQGMLHLHIGLARSVTGEKELALQDLQVQRTKVRRNAIYRTRLMAGIYYINQFAGTLSLAKSEAQRIQSIAQKHKLDYTYNMSICMEAAACFCACKLHEALPLFRTAGENRYNLHKGVALDAMAGKAITLQLLYKSAEADKSLEELESFENDSNPAGQLPITESCRARISLLRDDMPAALEWEHTLNEVPGFAGLFVWLEVPALTQIRVLIASGRSASLKKAEGLLEVFLKVSEAYYLVNQTIEALVLKSLLLAEKEQHEKALEVLAEVISLAEPGHFIRPFIEAGPAMQGLLEKLLTKNDYPDYTKHLMNSTKKFHNSNGIHASTDQAPKNMFKMNDIQVDNEPLSPRELEITNLLAEGLRNKEIAGKLYVSEGTIKKHIYNMCQKWSVHNRINLIKKARELGYIGD